MVATAMVPLCPDPINVLTLVVLTAIYNSQVPVLIGNNALTRFMKHVAQVVQFPENSS